MKKSEDGLVRLPVLMTKRFRLTVERESAIEDMSNSAWMVKAAKEYAERRQSARKRQKPGDPD